MPISPAVIFVLGFLAFIGAIVAIYSVSRLSGYLADRVRHSYSPLNKSTLEALPASGTTKIGE
ncbi:MAG: hypothetical protein AAGH38_01880 [Pseudomonadota bacterium]